MALRKVPASLQSRLFAGQAAVDKLAEPDPGIVTARGKQRDKVDLRGRRRGALKGVAVHSLPGQPPIVRDEIPGTRTAVPTPTEPVNVPPTSQPAQPDPTPAPEPSPEPTPESPEPDDEKAEAQRIADDAAQEAADAAEVAEGQTTLDDAAPEPVDYTAETKSALIETATSRGIDATGTKAEIVARLTAADKEG